MGLKFRLIALRGIDENKSFEFDQEEITIGRIVNNTLVLNDQTVSRKHACIRRYNNQYKIMDMGSQNGIERNGQKIQESVLENDDEITIGNTIFRFKFDKGQAATQLSEDTVIIKRDKSNPSQNEEVKDKVEGAFKKISDMVADEPEKSNVFSPHELVASERKETVIDLIDKITADPQKADFENTRKFSFVSFVKKPFIKISLISFSVLIILLVFLSGKKDDLNDSLSKAEDLSETPIELPAPGVYGINSKGDKSHPDKVIFTFNYGGEKAFVDFEEGGTEYDEVIVLLNNQKILSLPSSPNGWFSITKYELPREFLIKGTNKIVFDNVLNPPKNDTWGIQKVKVYENPYPECSITAAQECLKLGDVRFKEKLVSYGNTYDAYQNYNKALDYIEKCEPKPEFYFETKQKMRLAAQYLDSEYQKHLASALQAKALGNISQVKSELEIILKLFPEIEDYRHQKANKLLNSLN